MAYRISPVFNGQLFNNQGKPLAGGRIIAYVGGSFSTLAPIYANHLGTTSRTNPMILDASGRAPAFFLETGNLYNLVLTASDGTTVLQTFENISVA